MNISDLKKLVEKSALDSLKEAFQQILTGILEPDAEWDYLFQKVYLHACLKGQVAIANWMEQQVFPTLPPIQQMAIRQVFAYGHVLLRKYAKK
jgi:hypothetical protein